MEKETNRLFTDEQLKHIAEVNVENLQYKGLSLTQIFNRLFLKKTIDNDAKVFNEYLTSLTLFRK